MNGETDWQRIQPVLEKLNDIDTLKRLFVEELNYDQDDQELIIEFPKSVKDKVTTHVLEASRNQPHL